jgi:endonuclease G, mitochondrial
MTSAVVSAAIFAAGAVVGGGVATAISYQRRRLELVPIAPSPSPAVSEPTVVQLNEGGQLEVQNLILSSVLKYGNPGPIADMIVRKAYVAAYDRRLRHPAWVRFVSLAALHLNCV